jgi:hypothetical protein
MNLIRFLFLYTRPIRGDKLDYVVHIPKIESRWDIKDLMSFIKTPKSTVQMQNGQTIHFYPTKVRIPVDKKHNHKKIKVVAPKYYDSIVPYIDVDIKEKHCTKID